MEEIARVIRALMGQRDLDVEDLAAAAQVDRRELGACLSGASWPATTLVAVADAVGADALRLFRGLGERSANLI